MLGVMLHTASDDEGEERGKSSDESKRKERNICAGVLGALLHHACSVCASRDN